MSERKEEVRTFLIYYMCDSCGGKVFPTGLTLTCNPPIHIHRCTSCGRQYEFKRHYPIKVHEPISEDKI